MDEKIKQYLIEMIGYEQYHTLTKEVPRDRCAIVLSGPHISGKTTLARVLRKEGYDVIEDFLVVPVKTVKPLDHIIRDYDPYEESQTPGTSSIC